MTAARPRRVATAAAIVVALVLGASCAGKRERRVEDVLPSGESRYRDAIEALSRNQARKAKEGLEQIDDFGESGLRPLVHLAFADITFYEGDDVALTTARSNYLDFVTQHRDHPMAPYAQFQAGICALKQVNDPSRDQRQTRDAIDLLREVVRLYPESPFARAAEEMIEVGNANLAEHEYLVGRFYLKRKAYEAAAGRLRGVLDRYPRYRDREKVYFDLGRSLLRGDKAAEGRVYLEQLLAEYPASPLAPRARKLLRSARAVATDGLPEAPAVAGSSGP